MEQQISLKSVNKKKKYHIYNLLSDGSGKKCVCVYGHIYVEYLERMYTYIHTHKNRDRLRESGKGR